MSYSYGLIKTRKYKGTSFRTLIFATIKITLVVSSKFPAVFQWEQICSNHSLLASEPRSEAAL